MIGRKALRLKDLVSTILKKPWEYVLLWGPTAPVVKQLLGKRLHQKLAMWPRIGYWPRIENPRTFNEKIMHRKLFSDDKTYQTVSDKYLVRDYVREKVGDEILNTVYHVTDDPSEISFQELPDDFVIKPTHGSGWVIVVDGIEDEDIESLKSKCANWLSETYGSVKGEYWYKDIPPRIMIEKRLEDSTHGTPFDFKFFVFHGEVKYIQVDYDRFSGHTRRLYERDWTPLDCTLEYPLGPIIDEPIRLDEMISVAETLGETFDFVRVDLYLINEEDIIFGELTLAPGSGGERFRPKTYDFEFGSHW